MWREGEKKIASLMMEKKKIKIKKITTTAILFSFFLSCFFILLPFCVLLYSSETGREWGQREEEMKKVGGFANSFH